MYIKYTHIERKCVCVWVCTQYHMCRLKNICSKQVKATVFIHHSNNNKPEEIAKQRYRRTCSMSVYTVEPLSNLDTNGAEDSHC